MLKILVLYVKENPGDAAWYDAWLNSVLKDSVPFNSLFSHLSSEATFLMVIKWLQQFQASHPDLWKKDKSDYFLLFLFL